MFLVYGLPCNPVFGNYTSPDLPGVVFRVRTLSNICLWKHLGGKSRPANNDNSPFEDPEYA